MKFKIFILSIAFISVCSCQNGPNQNQTDTVETLFGFAKGNKSHQFIDARTGLVTMTSEYPSDWKVISKPTYTIDQKVPIFLTQIQGPNNLQAFTTPIRIHIDYPVPEVRHWMQQYSSFKQFIKPIPSREQIMQSEVNTKMANAGFTLVGQKKMPRAERYIRKTMDEKGAQQANFQHYATEWINNKGQKALVTLVNVTMKQPVLGSKMVMWFYSLNFMFVDDEAFETT